MSDIPLHKRIERQTIETQIEEFFAKKEDAIKIETGKSGAEKVSLTSNQRRRINSPNLGKGV